MAIAIVQLTADDGLSYVSDTVLSVQCENTLVERVLRTFILGSVEMSGN